MTRTETRSRRGARLSLIIPMHNEAAVLPTTLAAIKAALGGLGVEYEIIGVDDGSTDDTFAVLSRLAEADPRLRGSGSPATSARKPPSLQVWTTAMATWWSRSTPTSRTHRP